MKRVGQIALPALFVGAIGGCATGDGGPRIVSLNGVPGPWVTLVGETEEGFTVHGLQARQRAEGLAVSGRVGPAARVSRARSGHIDIRVISPDGREATRASGGFEPISASPKTFVERRFSVVVPGTVPAGSQVRVAFHAVDGLCSAAGANE